MTKEELVIRIARERGVFEYIYYMQANPVLLPEDAPAEVKCAWMRLYSQGSKDVQIIDKWLATEEGTT